VIEKSLARGQDLAKRLVASIREVIIGQDETVEAVVMALLAGGHVLLEGAPGLGKTHLVRTLSTLVDGHFARIQFTPDLMPSDVVGTSLVVTTESGSKDLRYRPGPIFANMVLADEINRATPKTQSALLEAMAERTVTVEGTPRPLPAPFFVLATENPIEMEGVFPLPEAQLDRFLVKLVLTMPSLEALTAIGARPVEPPPPEAITGPSELLVVQALARTIVAAPHVERYAARLVLATHEPREVRYGAGPRAAQALMACARVRCLMEGRVAVAVDDIRAVAPPVLRHRLILGFEAEAAGLTADHFVARAIEETQVTE
jgi:MoxR-like ATPase